MSDSVEIVGRYHSVGEAFAAQSALRAAGIEAELADANTIGIDWLYSQAIGGVKVTVPAGDAERAVEILGSDSAETDSGVTEEEAEAAFEEASVPQRCASCGSTSIVERKRLPLFLLLGTLILGAGVAVGATEMAILGVGIVAIILFLAGRFRCAECGEPWSGGAVEREEATIEPAEEIAPLGPPCPRCGSTDTSRAAHRRLKAATLLASPILLLWPFVAKHECDACGAKW